MKQRIFGWIATLLSAVLTLAAVEIAATLWQTLHDGHYTPAPLLFERTPNLFIRDVIKNKGCVYADTLFPHPYLAFVHTGNPPCGPSNVNNIGLFNADFPNVRRTDRYVVLLTGGSVASQLGQNLPPPAPHYLENELNRRYISPNGRPFLVLNGGDGAWKEPQQLILFSMYATLVDAVVVLDGFNEHYAFLPGTRSRLERPASNFMEINPLAGAAFGDIAGSWLLGRIAADLSSSSILRHSHAAYFIASRLQMASDSREILNFGKRTTVSSLFALPQAISSDPDKLFALQLSLYQGYERDIEAIARDENVKTAYFLQPVPAWGKSLTEEERLNAGNLSYGALYRRLVGEMLTLRDRGLPIYDLGAIYEKEGGRIYADDIHCWRGLDGASPGYQIMAAQIAGKLADAWHLKPRSDIAVPISQSGQQTDQ